MENKQWISDVISEEYKEWTNEECIFIDAGTGCGKSHFVKNTLYQYAKDNNKKILLLSNRDNLKQQNLIETEGKEDVITCENYQRLEYQNKYDWYILLEKYIWMNDFDYVVCDESDYFFRDANFNSFTDISLYNILETKKPIKIFMTATPELIKQYFNDNNIKIKEYTLQKDYSYINKVVFYYDQILLEENILDKLDNNEKVMYFCKSAKTSYELFKKYKDKSSFICSKYNKEYSQYICHDELESIIHEEKFNKQILFTSMCMDNGVNIKDTSIKNIIIDCDDISTLIQCLGRYRIIDNSCKINLYIKAKGNTCMGGIITANNKLLSMAKELDEYGECEFISRHPREDYTKIIYDITINNVIHKRVNNVMRAKCKERVVFAERCVDLGENGFCKFIIPYLDRLDYEILDESFKAKTIEEYLQELVGKRLFKDEQQKLINLIDMRVHGEKKKSISCMNKAIECMELNYEIISKVVKVNNKAERCWIINKVTK